MKRKIIYNCRMFKTSIPKEIIEHMQLEDADQIEYIIKDNGDVIIKKVTKVTK